MSKLSICVPVYNEEKTVRELLDKVLAVPLDKEVIVVDDGSTDKTAEVLQEYVGNPLVKIIVKQNGGKGTALREAFKQVSGDYVVIQDADLEYSPNDFVAMLEVAKKTNSLVVYGSRFLNKKTTPDVLKNLLASRLLSTIVGVLYGQFISDESTCYKLFRTDLLKSVDLVCKRFEFCPEITAKILKRGIKITEVPISFYTREAGDGKKIHYLRDGLEAVITLLKYRFND